ncbi:MAG: hypothetical protein M1822_008077 [Bathelium mastoideum]|nr:MAG: hypothetical protein M1822_008077 [Bathelium mastoideum]
MGPDILSLSDPSVAKKVFTTKKPWKKTPMVSVNDVMVNGQRVSNLFCTQDEDWHDAKLKPIKSLYSMTKVQDFEANVDLAIDLFVEKLQERFVTVGASCDMAKYLGYFAWDAMSWVTFGKPLGILEDGNDGRKYIENSNRSLDYFAPISQIPELDFLFDKNPIHRIGPPPFKWANEFSLEAYIQRMQVKRAPDAPEDYLDRFIEAKSKYPDVVDDHTVVVYLLSNVLAGSDTTAIAMRAALYYTLKNPQVHRSLCQELEEAKLSLPISWKACNSLPYLDAVMREAMRIHPGVGLMLERYVPEGGLVLPDGRLVPENIKVGMNPWVVNRNEDVFGPDADQFKPERWLRQENESEEDFEARKGKMKSADLTFGAGSRVCLGRYLSQLESYKAIATLFTKYNVSIWRGFARSLEDPLFVGDAKFWLCRLH